MNSVTIGSMGMRTRVQNILVELCHQKECCKPFFKELRTHIDNYFDCMIVDHSKLDYHIIKSWVGYHKDNETPSVKPHNHNASDLSFVYYLNTDSTSDKFCVAQEKNPNECVGDLFTTAIQRIRLVDTISTTAMSTHYSHGRHGCNLSKQDWTLHSTVC